MIKKIFLIIFLAASCNSIFAQGKGDTIPNPMWEITCFGIHEVDTFPLTEEFLLEFVKTVADSCVYSQDIFNDKDKVTVYVGLRLNRNGYLGNFSIVRSVSNDLDNEVLAVMKRLCMNKKYNPAFKKGMNVCVEFILPIKFYKKS